MRDSIPSTSLYVFQLARRYGVPLSAETFKLYMKKTRQLNIPAASLDELLKDVPIHTRNPEGWDRAVWNGMLEDAMQRREWTRLDNVVSVILENGYQNMFTFGTLFTAMRLRKDLDGVISTFHALRGQAFSINTAMRCEILRTACEALGGVDVTSRRFVRKRWQQAVVDVQIKLQDVFDQDRVVSSLWQFVTSPEVVELQPSFKLDDYAYAQLMILTAKYGLATSPWDANLRIQALLKDALQGNPTKPDRLHGTAIRALTLRGSKSGVYRAFQLTDTMMEQGQSLSPLTLHHLITGAHAVDYVPLKQMAREFWLKHVRDGWLQPLPSTVVTMIRLYCHMHMYVSAEVLMRKYIAPRVFESDGYRQTHKQALKVLIHRYEQENNESKVTYWLNAYQQHHGEFVRPVPRRPQILNTQTE
jgi:hypothetical protein